MTDWTLIDHWVSEHSEQGGFLQSAPSQRLPLFNPEDNPVFRPQVWNSNAQKANCMAYALNALGENLQPGHVRPPHMCSDPSIMDEFMRVSHRLFTTNDQDEFKKIVRLGLQVDGLQRVQDIEGLYKPGHYLVGLYFVDASAVGANDFHFIRQDDNGLWSMAYYGNQGITFHDCDDEKIKNPATANLRSGMEFDGFYHVPKGGIETLRPRYGGGQGMTGQRMAM